MTRPKVLCLITVRKRSCGKVMFLHLSVSHSVHKGGVCLSACWDTHTSPGRHPPARHPPGQTPSLDRHPTGQTHTPSRRPLQWTVRILLECFLVWNEWGYYQYYACPMLCMITLLYWAFTTQNIVWCILYMECVQCYAWGPFVLSRVPPISQKVPKIDLFHRNLPCGPNQTA